MTVGFRSPLDLASCAVLTALPPPTPALDTIETEDTSFVINRAVNFLLQEHGSRVVASNLFPPRYPPHIFACP
ncbi:hypothetical protein N7486_005026 [Penicillium sp. IBT 16267x]|nr:hypothetical protein N7486_005026 [Penicillium sp. IBT 16267x]